MTRSTPSCSTTKPQGKPCARCGRLITWRKKWERDWEAVRFCSDACKSNKLSDVDVALEASILSLLKQRGRDKTICPSEAARAVAQQAEVRNGTPPWQELMEPAREAARRLYAKGLVFITQAGQPVNPSTARGPIRLKAV